MAGGPVVPQSTFDRGVYRSGSWPARFRLYPEVSSRRYLIVQIWPSLKAMRGYLKGTYPSKESYRRTLGMCSSFSVVAFPRGRPQRMRPIFAEVNLAAANLTMRIVTHELMHATLAYARRASIDLAQCVADIPGSRVCDVEERVCSVHDRLCAGFVHRAKTLGLYE